MLIKLKEKLRLVGWPFEDTFGLGKNIWKLFQVQKCPQGALLKWIEIIFKSYKKYSESWKKKKNLII